MSKHTPGPWRFSGDSVWHGNGHVASTWSPRVVSEDREDGESWLDMRNRTQPERDEIASEKQANIRLIAAAPELLEALIKLVDSVDPESSGWSEAVAAIDKATGSA